MLWLSWRQLRGSVVIASAGLLVAILAWVTTRPGQNAVTGHLVGGNDLVQLLNTGAVAVPVVIGAFWGAPLVARELETGTWRLAWTQSVSRTRWLTVKMGVVGLIGLTVASVTTIGVDWWSRALDSVDANRFAAGTFGERGVVPVSYTAFALALGIALGLVLRKTIPAVAATLAVFTAVRIVVTLYVRPHFAHPVTTIASSSHSSVTNTGGWVISQTTYQPGDRFWAFQWMESGLFLALAAGLVGLSFWWLRHRIT